LVIHAAWPLRACTLQYAIWDSNHIDHDTSGDKTYHFHPPLSTTAEAIPTLQDLDNSGSKLSCATRHFAAVVDNHAWIKFYDSTTTPVPPTSFQSACPMPAIS
jgi:hypothetical protein